MNFSSKVIIFFLGLSLGLLIGAGFFIFKIDDYIGRLELFKRTPDTVVTITHDKESERQKLFPNKIWPGVKKNSSRKDSSIAETDSVKTVVSIDSVRPDSFSAIYQSGQEDIVVKKDEMIAAAVIDVTNVSAPENKSYNDSLLQKESGVRDDKNTGATYQVEFWQSPINYKGYKMLKNKIVLFGIAQNENLRLYRIEDALYMKQQQNVYRLAYTNDFRQFESVKDQAVLAKLNKPGK